jgi:hypothetical protein
MPTQPFYRILTLAILLTLAVSCGVVPVPARGAPQTPPTLLPVPVADSSSTPPPAAPTDTVPAPTQKPPRGTKAPGNGQGQGQGSDASQSLDFTIPEHTFDVILGRPTGTSVTLSILSATDQTVTIAYGEENAAPETQTINLKANTPTEITIQGLTPDTSYQYTINNGETHTFHTARPSGSTFIFTIQADSHLDSNTSAAIYLQTLANQRELVPVLARGADNPDFVIDLGDTFMTDKYKPYTEAAPQYLAQRYFLGQLGKPLYLVLGNHDGEGAPRGKEGVEMSTWAAQQRTQYFPNPLPDSFYSGNSEQSYYAWTWGDALFIVLDPYTFTPPLRNDSSLWTNTLGAEQYQWLKSTLETSRAKWKFVFIHQLLSGYDKNGRGGVEVAPFYEWGGKNPDGSNGFAANRPGWEIPIHQLLITHNVTAVFHGHDHLFVKQELDGIIYQECPQPGATRSNTDSAAEYGYLSGDILGGPGHIRVTVSPNGVTVDYVSSTDGQVIYSYTIQP